MAELKEYVTSLEDEKSQLTAQVMTLQDEAKQWQLRLEQHNQGEGHELMSSARFLSLLIYVFIAQMYFILLSNLADVLHKSVRSGISCSCM